MAPEFDREQFVSAFFGYHATNDQRLFWSWELFYSDWDRCDEKLALVLALVAAAPDPPSLTLVGAFPLEDLLQKCGDAVIDRVELEAEGNPKLCDALVAVWGLERHPAIEARVNRVLATRGLPSVRHLSDEALRRADAEIARAFAESTGTNGGPGEGPPSDDITGH